VGNKIRALFVVVLLAATSISLPQSASAMTDGEREARDTIVRKINRKRITNHHLPQLKTWNKIHGQTQKHSTFLAENGFRGRYGYLIAHKGFCDNWTWEGGCGAFDDDPLNSRSERIFAAGSGLAGMCEIVASVGIASSPTRAADVLVGAWERSEGHADCMFDQTRPHVWIGVGVRHTSTGWYATAILVGDSTPDVP
jgi:hypothetical protein